MRGQLKYSFKKEKSLFFRRYIFLGVVLSVFGFTLSYPLMYKMVVELFSSVPKTAAALCAVLGAASSSSMPGNMDLSQFAKAYDNAELVYSMTLVSIASYSLLIMMLVMRSAAGGEQKNRAMIVPLCAGLRSRNYLLPKFIIYPLTVFVMSLLGGLSAGAMSNALFENGRVDGGLVALSSLFIAVYALFVISVYLSLGVCTQRPGLITGAVFLGQLLLQSFLDAAGLGRFQPFALVSMVSGPMFKEDFDLSAEAANIAVSVGLALVISVLMFFLALGVTNARRIDNQEEIKPEF